MSIAMASEAVCDDSIVTPDGKPFDIVVCAGSCSDATAAAGGEQRKGTFLTIGEDAHPASIPFLREYFRYNRDVDMAARALVGLEQREVTCAGPYIRNLIAAEGYTVALVPHCEGAHLLRLKRILEAGTRVAVVSTAMIYAAELVEMVCGFIKECAPDTTVICGGTHILKAWKLKQLVDKGVYNQEHVKMYTAVTQQLFLDVHQPLPVDAFIVNARGEITLRALLKKMLSGDESWREMDNIIHWRKDEWVFNTMVEEPYTPLVMDWSLILPPDSRCFVPIPVATGCPFHCSFCDFWDLHSKETRHPIEVIIGNIRSIPVVDDVRRIFFTDDNLIPNKEYGMKFLKILYDADLHMRWISFIRAATVTEELAEMMAKTGCTKVMIGVESAAYEVQKNMNKVISPDKLVAAIRALNKNGISTFTTYICGFPGETEDTFRTTLDTMNQYPCEYNATNEYQFLKFAALPLAKISMPELREKFHLIGGYLTWKHDTLDSDKAGELMERVAHVLKPDLTPYYPAEAYFIEDPGVTIEDKKQIIRLRGLIARAGVGIVNEDNHDQAALWNALEAIFKKSEAMVPPMQKIAPPPEPVVLQPGQKRRPKVDVQKVMSDHTVIKRLMKSPKIWLQVTNPKMLGKLMQAAVDPSVLDKDPKLARLCEKLQKITGIGAEGGAHTVME
eukprot:TRINITY_DN392_c0_g3_i1.p1 TRINITY_DN392_c0_g3~~TRINITY_DN392_c0_g3_i1.p1  ORF type:complete len:674 (-),score=231.80 TRINITY_DN392_c0_g3_i1:76-2097(-)